MCCGETGTLKTNIAAVCGQCSQCVDHTGFAPTHGMYISWSTLLSLQAALQGNCPKQALDFFHFLGLSCSGLCSQVLHKGIDDWACVLCCSQVKQLRRPGAWRAHCPSWAVRLNHFPSSSHLVSWVCSESALSSVPCVSSRELISGCNSSGSCQPSRNPRRLGVQLGGCSQFGRGCCLWV